jgi:hypothetical protein
MEPCGYSDDRLPTGVHNIGDSMNSTMMIGLMFTHVLTDWILQDRETAKNKSSNNRYLFPHLFIIHCGLLIWAKLSGLNFYDSFTFAFLNTILHGIIDKNLIKVYKYLVVKRFPEVLKGMPFEYWEDKMFYDYIAIDQLLHGICYVLIWRYLS